jgi:protein TonB
MAGEQAAAKQQGQVNPLLLLLHDQIQQNLSYPLSAKLLTEQGITRLRFAMDRQGTISKISIVKSSGYPDLDQAAITTLQNISPLSNAANYLQQPQYFEIDIEFYL